ncbi:MAG: MATE family efflux transporter [Lagierella massiliensis]|nr:MATE family efflux transporter [Lagierella massiliensis]
MKRFFKFTIPSILSMWVFALYTMVDGYFVSNYVGELEFSAVNISMPVITSFFAIGILLSIGTQSKVGMCLGRKENYKANSVFSTAVMGAIIIGLIFCLFIYLFLDRIVILLGASGQTINYVNEYLRVIIPFGVFFILSYQLEILVKIDGSPHISAISVTMAAISNILLDYLFIVVFHLGVSGAAIATGIAQTISTVAFLSHFLRKKGRLKFVRYLNFSILKKTIPLGIGDAIAEIALGFTVFLFNTNLLKIYGHSALVAYTVISYISVFISVTMTGVAQGLAPIFSYDYGQRNYKRIKKYVEIGIVSIVLIGGFFIIIANYFSKPIVDLFLDENSQILKETMNALKRYAWAYPFVGLNGLLITFFASLAKGRIATVLSILRTPILISIVMFFTVKFLPDHMIWYVLAFSEALVFPIGFYFLIRYIVSPLKNKI